MKCPLCESGTNCPVHDPLPVEDSKMDVVKHARARVQLVIDGKLLEYSMDVTEMSIHNSDYYEFEIRLVGVRTDENKWETP